MASADRRSTARESLFAAPEMLRYFAELDELLTQSGVVGQLHLHIAGGAVIATKSDSRLTADVDVISEGMTDRLRRSVEEISRRHPGLRADWLNDGAKLKRVNLPIEPERIYTGRSLVIDSAGDRYVLAMKLVSGRPIDEADCEILIRGLGIRTETELLDLLTQAVPAHLQTPAMGYFAADRLDSAYPSRRSQRRPSSGLSL